MSDTINLSTFNGKSILVMGGASGIGLAIVTRFARVGARVTIADLYSSAGKSIAADLTSQGYSVTFASCDVTEYSSCVAAFKHAMDFSPTKSLNAVALMAGVVGEPSSLVEQVLDARNNSAGSQRGERELEPPRPCHRALDVNLLGVYDCAYLALWYMSLDEKKEAKKDGEGPGVCKEKGGTKSLILISSTVAYTDVPQFADYHTSKFGVRGLFRNLRHVTPGMNIRTNCLAPYLINTPLVENAASLFHAAGIDPGKNMHFANIETVVDAAARFVVDETLDGRVVAIMPEPEGEVDLRDDEDGLWGGEEFKGVVERRKAAGDVI